MDQPINPQFAQPSKVIHIRNLPFDVSDEEIRELCRPWGQVVAVKGKVGSNRNQAFVEFADLHTAMGIVGHYQGSTEQAQVRGRQVFLNFSGRERLTNMAATDLPSPVLYLYMPDVAHDLWSRLTVDLLTTVFGAFAYVYKLVMHPSSGEGGMLAWLQFVDAPTAQQVRDALQGQQIPPHLLNHHPQPPTMHLSFSPHTDLPITVQSHSSRDFMDPSLPWGDPDPSLITLLMPQGEGVSPVLSINFERATYPVTLDAVHTICSTYGTIQKIHIFEKEGKTVALVQFVDQHMALNAKQALEGHPMYDGGHNVMRPVYSKHRSLSIRPGDRSRDYSLPAPPVLQPATSAAGTAGGAQHVQHGQAGWSGAAGGGLQQAQQALQQPHWQDEFAQQAQLLYAPEQDAGVSGDDYVQAHENALKLAPTVASTAVTGVMLPYTRFIPGHSSIPEQQQYNPPPPQYAPASQHQAQPSPRPAMLPPHPGAHQGMHSSHPPQLNSTRVPGQDPPLQQLLPGGRYHVR